VFTFPLFVWGGCPTTNIVSPILLSHNLGGKVLPPGGARPTFR
jgi:hypothetical protein